MVVEKSKTVLQSLQLNRPKHNIQTIFFKAAISSCIEVEKHQKMHVIHGHALLELGKWEKLPSILFSASSTSI
jgi:hypothetical protein